MSHLPLSNLRRWIAVGTTGCLGLAGTAHGAIIVNNLTNVAPAGTIGATHNPATAGTPNQFSASSTDLLTGLTPTITYVGPGGVGSTTNESSAGPSAWTNGSITTVYNGAGVTATTAHAAYGAVDGKVGSSDNDTFVTYDLGARFNLSRAEVFIGWNDSGRDDSSFNLLVSADNLTFTMIASYLKGTDNSGAITTPVTNLHSIVDNGGASIASNIRYVQLQFTDADNGYAGLTEVDVFGTTVPEPTSALLVALGGIAALGRRRRA